MGQLQKSPERGKGHGYESEVQDVDEPEEYPCYILPRSEVPHFKWLHAKQSPAGAAVKR